ncbi:DUF5979 domain-containing protein [Microbacterium sp.]|uniref:DUF5979 domain-containing protein n=1 Tax=Microbacterium sp. TaxID=51671 RepID=UPI003F6F1895
MGWFTSISRSSRRQSRAHGRIQRSGRIALVATAILAVLAGGLVPTASMAAVGDAELSLQKSVVGQATTPIYRPGDTFQYQLDVSCASLDAAGCINAAVTDALPAPLVFGTPAVQSVTGVGTRYTISSANNSVTVAFIQPLDGADVGLEAGTSDVTIVLNVQVPTGLTVQDGGPVTNTGTATASNAVTVPASTLVNIQIDQTLSAAASKSAQSNMPAGQPIPAVPGRAVGWTIGGANTSNTTVDSLTIQDPGDAASDPFGLLALTGISALRPPAGADTVDVFWRDAGGTWASVAGPVAIPADPNDLVAGLTLSDVHGLRFVFTNSAGDIGIQPIASGASIQLATVTRPSVVDIPDGSTVTVTDTAQVQVANGGVTSPNANASASVQIRRIKPTVAVTKVWDRPTVLPGETRTATIGTSVGDAPVARMVIAEPGAGGLTLQQQGLDFVGWTTADIEWPLGATGATITYAYTDGAGTPQSTTTRDTLPAPEAGRAVNGFTVEFTGLMNAAQFATLPFVVRAQPVPGQADVRSLNSASAQVFDELGQQSDVGFSEAALTRQPLRITASIQKDISRDWIWSAVGATTLVQLPAAVSVQDPNASTVGAQSLVVSDPGDPQPGDPPTDFWDHFDLQQIVSTEVPAGSQLTITYWNGSAWVNLPGGAGVDIAGPSSGFTYTPSAALREQIQGVRYSFTPLPAGGLLPPGFNVLPYYRVELRDSLRSDPGADLNGTAAVVTNDAAATVVNPNATPGSSTATDSDSIELRPATGGPGSTISKGWLVGGVPSDDLATTTAQTDAQSSLRITWGTNDFPFDSVTITDPATDPANVAGSLHDAFDLVRIQPITAATDPLMTFDAVSQVSLYSSATGGWVDITSTVCGATGALCDGTFPGYTLTTAQRASTLAVRVVFIESPTRASRATAPTDPAVGTGVAGSGVVRPLDLTYQLRQDRRSDPSQAVLGTANGYTYNSGVAGVVDNTASLVGVDPDVTYTSTDGSLITILDSPINVSVTKAFDQSDVGIPPSDTDPALFPLVTGTITATNTSAGKIRSLLVSDPGPTQAAPTIYETMNLYEIAGITVPVGATATTVTLSRGGAQTTYTLAQALALTSAQLADVTAVSVEHTGFIASQGSSTITLVYRERTFTRDGQAAIAPGTVGLNVAEARITSPGGTPANVPVATASDDLIFVLPTYSVSAGKTFNATSRYEDQSSAYVVTLRSRPAGTARTTTLAFEDATATFWNAFSFTSFPQATLPTPVRRIKVDALVGIGYSYDGVNLVATCGGSTDLTACWRNGVYVNANATSGAVTPVLPAGVTAAQVRGLRFSFQTATGGNWERPYNPEVVVSMNVTRNATLRYGLGGSTTQPVPSTQPGVLPAPGEPVQGRTTDTLDVDGVASWRNGPSLWEAEASSTATTTLLHRATALRIVKTPTGPQSPENDIDFTITVTNTGARAISNLILTDLSSTDSQGALLRPAERDAGDTTPIFSFGLVGSNGQAKPVTGFSASFSTTTGRLTINVPPGFVFAVGDVLTIFADMAFRIGLEPETPVLNAVTATADRILDSCVGSVNTALQPPLTNVPNCEAVTQVSPTPAAPLRITKWVKGVGAGIPGADPADPNYDDLGTLAFNVPTNQCLSANGTDGYWRTPCIPITRPGGTETWKIEVTNLGNIPATVISGIDVLPAYGDSGVIINSPRQSAWPVTFAGNVQYLSGLTTGEQRRAYYMTTAPNTACNAADILRDTSGTILPSNPCYADVTTRNWIPLTDTMTPAQMASVRALKVVVDFANRATQGLPPGESLRVTYDTTTAWQPNRAETQDRDAIAWNSVAVGARGVLNDLNYTTTVVEPRKIGVAMATGKIDLAKEVVVPDGWDPSISMPASYDFDVSCTSGPQQVTLVNTAGASMSRVNLAADGTVLHYADGATPATSAWSNVNLPLYAECSLTEATPTPGVLIGYSAQPITALRDWSTRTNVVNSAYPDPIELNQITATNTYQLAGFSVEKAVDNGPAVDQDGNPIQYLEDYAFTASCLFLGQQVIPVAERSFVLDDGEVIEFTGLPAGSTCRVTETNPRGAAQTYTQVSVAGVPGPNDPDPIADFDLVANLPDSTALRTAVTVTNVYTAGSASITKAIDGAGGTAWGDADFTVGLRCTLAWGDPQLVFQSTQVLNRAAPTWNIANLARGAVCTVSETASGGANSTTITPTTFTVTDAATPALATITNTFTTGSLSVRKTLSGAPAASLPPATQGTYVVSLACTRTVNGQSVGVAIPGGATRTITGAGTVTYTGLPTGAVCVVTEPDDGFAGSHTVTPSSLTIGNGTTVAATVTNVFPNGALALTKVVSGPGADDAPATFGATVTCRWQGAAVPLAAGGRVTLRPGATTVVSNIPVDSVCSIVEDDAGQDQTIYTPATAVIVPNTSPTATIRTENVYLLASLRVSKNVEPNEGAVPTGFGMSVECSFNGATVLPLTNFTLDGGGFRDFTGLPGRARCVIIETDDRGAAATISEVVVETPTAPPVVTQSRSTVLIPELTPDLVADQPRNRVTFTNLFDVSGMLVEKDFAGTAADQVGLGQSFTLDIVCVNAGEIVLAGTAVLSPENGYTLGYYPIAAQTRCEITETDSAFADAVVITPNEGDPATGVIIIPTEGVGSVAVTNWYLGGSLEVTKVLTGEGAQKFGTGDFEVTLACTLRGDELEILDGPIRTISAAAPTATFNALPTGAECRIAETDTGGATRHWLADADGVPLPVDEGGGYTFSVVTDATELTDTDQPQPAVTAVNEFLFAAVSATKAVRTFSGGVPENAPDAFPIQVTCTLGGLPVSALEDALQFVAVDGTAEWTELPVGAECEITETDAGDAIVTTVAVDGGAPMDSRTTTIVLEEGSADEPSVAAFVNTFSDPLPVTGAPVPWAGILLGGGMLLLGLVLVLIRRRRA